MCFDKMILSKHFNPRPVLLGNSFLWGGFGLSLIGIGEERTERSK